MDRSSNKTIEKLKTIVIEEECILLPFSGVHKLSGKLPFYSYNKSEKLGISRNSYTIMDQKLRSHNDIQEHNRRRNFTSFRSSTQKQASHLMSESIQDPKKLASRFFVLVLFVKEEHVQ